MPEIMDGKKEEHNFVNVVSEWPLSTVIWYVVLQQCHDLKESSELFKHRTARLKACFNEK